MLDVMREGFTFPRVKTGKFSGFIFTLATSFACVAAYAGTAPNQPANAANVYGACVTPIDVPTPTPTPTKSCKVNYEVTGLWSNSFTATITVQNTGKTAIQGWTLRWSYVGSQTVLSAWNGNPSQSGKVVNVASAQCNGTIPAGGTTTFGILASYSGTNTNPTLFTLQ